MYLVELPVFFVYSLPPTRSLDSFWNKKVPKSVPREILKHLLSLSPDLVLVVTGVRRCGKSTLLAQMMEKLKLPVERCFFLNFEDPRLSESLNHETLSSVTRFAEEKYKTVPLSEMDGNCSL